MVRNKFGEFYTAGTGYKGAYMTGHDFDDITCNQCDVWTSYHANPLSGFIALQVGDRDRSFVTEIDSDHIQLFKEIIKIYEAKYKMRINNRVIIVVILIGSLLFCTGGKSMAWTYVIGNGDYGNVYTTGWKYSNAWEVWQYFVSRGATEQAAAGLLGNMSCEGEMNPGQIEHNHDPNNPQSGRGLIGWTPGTKIINYAQSIGGNWYDGDVQCGYLYYRPEGYPSGNYNFFANPTKGYNFSWSEYLQITDVATAVLAFFYEAERPTVQDAAEEERRKRYAQGWYDEFHGQTVEPVTPVTPPTPTPGPNPPLPQPPGSVDMTILGGRDVMRRIWFHR